MMRWFPLAALLGVAACGPLVQIGGNAKPPVALLTLRATAVPQAAATDMLHSVGVLTPGMPGALQTLRVPVITRDTELQYLTGATWVEQPNKQFARVLADTIAAKGIPVLDTRQSRASATRLLSGQLIDFSLDVRRPGQPRVVLRFDALLTGDSGKTLKVRRFEASAAVGSEAPGDVAAALNGIANMVAIDVAAWVAS